MAPRKRKAEGGEEAAKPETAMSVRMTRSATRQANSNSTESAAELTKAELPKKNKNAEAAPKRKKEEVKAKETESENEAGGDESKKRTIVIEHCKQCNSFKKRAYQVKDSLEKDVTGITVLLNPEKPRRGCFEIREEGGEKFVSLLDMKRPFKPMKDLDMSQVISDIVGKLK